jgi:hypothetical protein
LVVRALVALFGAVDFVVAAVRSERAVGQAGAVAAVVDAVVAFFA